uniref:hypothetical protein n=1 Tax=Fulvivirga sp. TaxID=1931237 RepID=UPI004049CA97
MAKINKIISDQVRITGDQKTIESIETSVARKEIIRQVTDLSKNPTVCKNCGVKLLEDQDKDLFCPDDCNIFYSIARKKWFSIY